MSALEIFNGVRPQYTATLFLELYKTTDGIYEVEIHYKNVTDSEKLYQMNVTGTCHSRFLS